MGESGGKVGAGTDITRLSDESAPPQFSFQGAGLVLIEVNSRNYVIQ